MPQKRENEAHAFSNSCTMNRICTLYYTSYTVKDEVSHSGERLEIQRVFPQRSVCPFCVYADKISGFYTKPWLCKWELNHTTATGSCVPQNDSLTFIHLSLWVSPVQPAVSPPARRPPDFELALNVTEARNT